MARPKYVQAKKTTLAASIAANQTADIIFARLVDLYGNALEEDDFGDNPIVFTFNPGAATEEIVVCTGFSVDAETGRVTLTGVTRALLGTSDYSVGGTPSAHAAGTPVVVSNNPQMYEAILTYIEDLAIAGVGDASTTSAGIVEEATDTEIDADTGAGGTTRRLFVNPARLATSKYGVRLPTAAEKIFLGGVIGMVINYAGASVPTGFLLCDGAAISRTTYADLFAAIGTTFGPGDGSTTFNIPDIRGRVIVGYSATAPTKVVTFQSRSSNTITVTGINDHALNELQTGQAVLYDTTGGVITGLTDNTIYYLIRVAYNQFQLATSVANANAGTAISLSSDGSGTQTFTVSLTERPLAQTGGEETHALTDAQMPSHSHGIPYVTGSGSGAILAVTSEDSPGFWPSQSAGSDATHNNMMPFIVLKPIIKT